MAAKQIPAYCVPEELVDKFNYYRGKASPEQTITMLITEWVTKQGFTVSSDVPEVVDESVAAMNIVRASVVPTTPVPATRKKNGNGGALRDNQVRLRDGSIYEMTLEKVRRSLSKQQLIPLEFAGPLWPLDTKSCRVLNGLVPLDQRPEFTHGHFFLFRCDDGVNRRLSVCPQAQPFVEQIYQETEDQG